MMEGYADHAQSVHVSVSLCSTGYLFVVKDVKGSTGGGGVTPEQVKIS
jgi:hypothetical protein